MVRTSFAALAALFLGACTQAPQPSPLAPQQSAAIKATCTKVMRLREGEAEFDGCVADLSGSLAGAARRAQLARAYADCAGTGLTRGTPDFSRCVLERENAAPAPFSAIAVADVRPADSDPESYYTASFDVRRQREQYACAAVGLEPGSQAFADCVTNLDTDLFNIGHPPG